MPDVESVVLSLTGPDSHTLVRERGVGSLVLGPAGSLPKPDLVAGQGEVIDWHVFDQFTVPAGYPWPRWIVYRGDDTSFLDWSIERGIERFSWRPGAARTVDAGRARIDRFEVVLHAAPLDVVLPASSVEFSVVGLPSLLRPSLAPEAVCPRLRFSPQTAIHGEPLPLPEYDALRHARSVDVSVPALRQPFDCASLLQFPGLTSLTVAGQLANIEALADLRDLEALAVRYCPDLSGLPGLDTWPNLASFIAWNVDEKTGKRLRTELKQTMAATADRGWTNSTVSKLRKPEWFTNEYGLPFSAWPASNARAATKAYRAAARAIADAAEPVDVEKAIRGFVRAINRLTGIDTIEREDAGEAAAQLAAETPFGQLHDQAQTWFDHERDF